MTANEARTDKQIAESAKLAQTLETVWTSAKLLDVHRIPFIIRERNVSADELVVSFSAGLSESTIRAYETTVNGIKVRRWKVTETRTRNVFRDGTERTLRKAETKQSLDSKGNVIHRVLDGDDSSARAISAKNQRTALLKCLSNTHTTFQQAQRERTSDELYVLREKDAQSATREAKLRDLLKSNGLTDEQIDAQLAS
jgi:hypothetical protein